MHKLIYLCICVSKTKFYLLLEASSHFLFFFLVLLLNFFQSCLIFLLSLKNETEDI